MKETQETRLGQEASRVPGILRSQGWWLVLILAVAVLLRVWYLAEVVKAPDFAELRQDLSVQDYHARAILSGDWTLPEGRSDPKIATTPYYRPPAYTYLLAVIYLFTGGNYLAPRIFNVILGLVSIVLMYRMVRLLFGTAAGVITAALMATYWGFIYYEGEINDPAVFVFLLPCILFSLHKWSRTKAARWMAVAGVLTGCYALMRPNILLYGPVMAVWALWVAWRDGRSRAAVPAWTALFCATLLTIAPVTLRNYLVSGEVVPISTYFGENLHIGNSEYSDGHTSWTPYLQELEGSGQFSVWEYDRIVQGLGREVGKENLTHSEASTIFMHKALAWIGAHPAAALRLTLKKAALFWSPWEITENKVVQYEKDYYPPLKFLPGFPYVFGLFLFGTILLLRDWRRNSLPGKPATKAMLPLIFGLIFMYWLSFLPFFVNARARHPLSGFLFMIGAYGVVRLFQFMTQKYFKAAALLTALLVLLVALASIDFVPYRPDKARWHYARADSWLRAGKVELAKAEAERMLRETFSLYMPFRIGHALALEKEYAMAERLLRAALGTEEEPVPYRQDLYYHIGVVLAADGRSDEARAAYEEALTLNPEDSRAHNDLAILLEEKKDLDGALTHYRAAVMANPEFVLAWSNLGDLLGRTGDTQGAIDAFKKALEYAPDDPGLQYNLGVQFMAAGDMKEAEYWYRATLEHAPKDVRTLNNLGLLLAGQGNRQEAEKLFRQALALAPEYTLARANLGNLFIENGDFEQGIGIYKEGAARFPEDAELLNGIGYQYALHGNTREARRWYERALGLQPDFARARINLAYACLQGEAYDEAFTQFQYLHEQEPGNPDFLLELGNLRARERRYEEAIAFYHQALQQAPDFEAAKKNIEALQALLN